MKLYRALNVGLLKKSYSAKMLFIGFVGIHVPLIGTTSYILLSPPDTLQPWQLITIILLLTLLATGVTLYLLNALLAPVLYTAKVMLEFRNSQEIQPLPIQYQDEVGVLMANVVRAHENIKKLNDEQLNFFSILVHDLRSPLNSILSLVELLNITDSEKERKGYLNMIRALCDKELNVIQDTMQLVMQENYQLKEHDKEYINLRVFLEDQLHALEGSRATKELKFELQVSELDLLYVQPDLFAHIAKNLLSNACKFSYAGGRISIIGVAHSTAYQVTVSDEGLGFEPDEKHKLFDRFTSVKKEGTQGEATSGIGLYLTKTLVEKHGGHIQAASKGVGNGAAFTVTLPYSSKLYTPKKTAQTKQQSTGVEVEV